MVLHIINFYLGACIASFISVIVQKDGLKWRRSYCLSYKQTLSWYELLPIFSFLLQKGSCRHCKNKIPSFLIFIELIGGIAFFKTDWYSKSGLIEFFLCLLLLMMSIFDYYYQEISFSIFIFSFLIVIIKVLLFEKVAITAISFFSIFIMSSTLGILVLLKKLGLADLFFYLIISFFYSEYFANLVFLFASLAVLTLYPKLKAQKQTHLSLPFIPFLFFSLSFLKLLI